MKIPDKKEWGEIDRNDLDAEHAYMQFFGKSFDEAIELFERNALYYQEDLLSMPTAVFNFYAPAFVQYLNSKKSKGDSDGASSFLHMFLFMLKNYKDIMTADIVQLLFETSKRIADNQEFYEADVDIYGKFSELFAEIKALVNGI